MTMISGLQVDDLLVGRGLSPGFRELWELSRLSRKGDAWVGFLQKKWSRVLLESRLEFCRSLCLGIK